jgi:hypothetical protein
MYGFPQPLYSTDMLGGQKMFNDTSMMFGLSPDKEIFYSIKNGNWNDINIWQTVSGAVGKLPTANDDVYIKHTTTLTGPVGTIYNCNNLFNTGTLNWAGNIGATVTLNVYGNLKSIGVINLKGASSSAILSLFGTDNAVSNLITDSSGNFIYSRDGNQNILDLIYSNLYTSGTGTKIPTNNLVVNNNLSISSPLDLWWWDLIVTGTTAVNSTLSKSYFGNVLFTGALIGTGGTSKLDFSVGNPNVELRGGISSGAFQLTFNSGFSTGTGTWSFTTNNQSIIAYQGVTLRFDCLIIISGAITLTILSGSGYIISLNNTINGDNASSKLLMGTSSVLHFATAASVPSMTTGTWDFTTFANTIGYVGNYTATIPSGFTLFHSLTIAGTGTKTLGVNTTLSGALSVAGGILQLSTFNLTVGTTTVISSAGKLYKDGAGNVIFIGLLSNGNSGSTLDFSLGNPTVECRGGINAGGGVMWAVLKFGTNTLTFSTNNQSISTGASAAFPTFDCPILISGAIILKIEPIGGACQVVSNNTINGDNAASTLQVGVGATFNGSLNLQYTNTIMTTGILDLSTSSLSYIIYNANGNFTLPLTSYNWVGIGGTGTKILSGNTVVLNLIINGILDLTTYDLTVNGTTTINGTLLKSGSGNLLFVGSFNMSSGIPSFVDFSGGNPSIESRGGLYLSNQTTSTFNSGTGIWTFSTNNQNVSAAYITSANFNGQIIVSGAITVTNILNSGVFTTLFVNNTINGDNAASRFDNRNLIDYKGAATPMNIGFLDTNLAANTFKYNLLGAQDVKGGTYRTLNFGGSGVKTLQGNVVVNTTAGGSWTITGTATINYNGFTITTI